jgi:hypothetical protein
MGHGALLLRLLWLPHHARWCRRVRIVSHLDAQEQHECVVSTAVGHHF